MFTQIHLPGKSMKEEAGQRRSWLSLWQSQGRCWCFQGKNIDRSVVLSRESGDGVKGKRGGKDCGFVMGDV